MEVQLPSLFHPPYVHVNALPPPEHCRRAMGEEGAPMQVDEVVAEVNFSSTSGDASGANALLDVCHAPCDVSVTPLLLN